MARARFLSFVVLALAAAACSPTQTFGTVEGMRCSNFGDEVCSQEAGFPRARCDFDNTWHILEHCGSATCIVENQSGGQHRTRCGNSPATGGGTRAVDANSGPKDTATFVDTAPSQDTDSKTEPKGDTTTAASVACGGYSCDGKEMCTFIGTCESKACTTACKHGERCSFGVCSAHCYGSCAATEYCKFSTGGSWIAECSKLGCALPMDLGTAVAAVGLQLAATPTAACAHLGGAKLALNQAMASVGIDAAALGAGIVGGLETLAFSDLAGKSNVALLGHADNAKPCPTGAPCGLTLSKGENLKPATAGTAGPCQLRWSVNGQGRHDGLPIPLRLGTVRLPLVLRNADVQIGGDLQTAEVCGYVSPADLNVALSGLSTASGLGFQLKQATQAGAGKVDIDSDGDGKLDAWSVALTIKLQNAILTKWSP